MRSWIAVAFAVIVAATSADAEEHDHVTAVGAIRILHAWVRAADAGSDTLVFLEIDNDGPADRLMTAGTEGAASARVVGITLTDGEPSVREIGALEIAAGETLLDPGGLAIQLVGLEAALVEGAETEIEITFEQAGSVHVHAEVLGADAVAHPHAGHEH